MTDQCNEHIYTMHMTNSAILDLLWPL